jgi:hypothetical protein
MVVGDNQLNNVRDYQINFDSQTQKCLSILLKKGLAEKDLDKWVGVWAIVERKHV